MKVYDAASLRNVALVGHSGSGKTQLVSALLFDAGAVNRFGKVDEGTTVTDYDDEESLGDGGTARPAPPDRAQPARSRARQPRSLARVAARRVRPHRDSDPAA